MIQMNHQVDAYKELTRRLGREPGDRAWDSLERSGRISALLETSLSEHIEEELDVLVAEIRSFEREHGNTGAVKKPKAPPEPHEIAVDRRARTLARIQAIEASRRSDVGSFRKKVLRGKLLDKTRPIDTRIRKWLIRKAKSQGEPTVLKHERFPASIDGMALEVSPGWENLHLYGVPIRAESNLGWLKDISASLGRAYGWDEMDSVRFVLADLTPRGFRGRFSVNPGRTRGADRIAIEVHPDTTAADIVKLFSWLKIEYSDFASDRGFTDQSKRAISVKCSELAIFAAEANDGRTWRQALSDWNTGHSEFSYPADRVQNFTRDARKAYLRIAGENLVWGKRE